jgi:hypothetical protein
MAAWGADGRESQAEVPQLLERAVVIPAPSRGPANLEVAPARASPLSPRARFLPRVRRATGARKAGGRRGGCKARAPWGPRDADPGAQITIDLRCGGLLRVLKSLNESPALLVLLSRRRRGRRRGSSRTSRIRSRSSSACPRSSSSTGARPARPARPAPRAPRPAPICAGRCGQARGRGAGGSWTGWSCLGCSTPPRGTTQRATGRSQPCSGPTRASSKAPPPPRRHARPPKSGARLGTLGAIARAALKQERRAGGTGAGEGLAPPLHPRAPDVAAAAPHARLRRARQPLHAHRRRGVALPPPRSASAPAPWRRRDPRAGPDTEKGVIKTCFFSAATRRRTTPSSRSSSLPPRPLSKSSSAAASPTSTPSPQKWTFKRSCKRSSGTPWCCAARETSAPRQAGRDRRALLRRVHVGESPRALLRLQGCRWALGRLQSPLHAVWLPGRGAHALGGP